MSALPPEIAAAARAWIAEDPDPSTASDLRAALAAAEAGDAAVADEIADAFAGTL
jgi:phosphomannomutase